MQQNHLAVPQQIVRNELRHLLARTRMGVTEEQWTTCIPDPGKRRKIQLRLCTEDTKQWRWKEDINSMDVLLMRFPNAENLGIADLFRKTANISTGQFKYLAPANRPNLLKMPSTISDPVLGFDVLIRSHPNNGFNSERDCAKNDLHIGGLSFCVVIHCDVASIMGASPKLLADSSIFRPVCGDHLAQFDIIGQMMGAITSNEHSLRSLMHKEDWAGIALSLATYANRAAGSIVLI